MYLLPIDINELISGKTVEWERIELKKVGIQRVYFTLFALLLMILTIGEEVMSFWV